MRNTGYARLLTRCVDCESISPVTVDALSVDAGLVHCMDCGVLFNAAWNLVDEVSSPIEPGSPTVLTARRSASHEHDAHQGPVEIRLQNAESAGRNARQAEHNLRHEPRLGRLDSESGYPGSIEAQIGDTGDRVGPSLAGRRPGNPWVWLSACICLAGLLFVQVRFLLFDELAGLPKARPYLSALCATLDCTLPAPFSGPVFRVTETKIDLHPDIPGAVIVKIHLLNRSNKDRSHPGIELNLSDRNGQVVGRRHYLPAAFLEKETNKRVSAGGRSVITLVLAQPEDNAVGFEARIIGNG